MAIPLSNEIRALLDAPNFAHLATLMPDGSPHSVPVWVGREGYRILICTGEGSLKAKNTRRDPRVALSLINLHNPYEEAQLRGRVVERRPDNDFQYLDAISHKYTGKPFPFRSPEGRVALVIEIDKARYTSSRLNMRRLGRQSFLRSVVRACNPGLGPVLRSVIDAQDLQILILNAIYSDVRQAREDQLAGPFDSPLATTAREVSQTATTIVESLCDCGGSVGTVLLNAANNVVEVLSGGHGPAQTHYGRSIF